MQCHPFTVCSPGGGGWGLVIIPLNSPWTTIAFTWKTISSFLFQGRKFIWKGWVHRGCAALYQVSAWLHSAWFEMSLFFCWAENWKMLPEDNQQEVFGNLYLTRLPFSCESSMGCSNLTPSNNKLISLFASAIFPNSKTDPIPFCIVWPQELFLSNFGSANICSQPLEDKIWGA